MHDHTILIELEKYLNEHLETPIFAAEDTEVKDDLYEEIHQSAIDDFIENNRKPTLNRVLFDFIDKKGVKDSTVYKRAGMDRRHFSKIRTNPSYKPRKNTLIALAFALELDKEETDELLSSAGYSLSDSDTNDLIIQFYLEKKIYDIDQVNLALHHYSQKTLP